MYEDSSAMGWLRDDFLQKQTKPITMMIIDVT